MFVAKLLKPLFAVYVVKRLGCASQSSRCTAQTPAMRKHQSLFSLLVVTVFFVKLLCSLTRKEKVLQAASMHHVSEKQDWYRCSWNAGSL